MDLDYAKYFNFTMHIILKCGDILPLLHAEYEYSVCIFHLQHTLI
jgi:hypothetical protein